MQPDGFITTTGLTAKNLLKWLSEELEECHYGRRGLIFTVHNGKVARVEQIRETNYKLPADEENG